MLVGGRCPIRVVDRIDQGIRHSLMAGSHVASTSRPLVTGSMNAAVTSMSSERVSGTAEPSSPSPLRYAT